MSWSLLGCAGSDDTKSKELIVTAQRSKALLSVTTIKVTKRSPLLVRIHVPKPSLYIYNLRYVHISSSSFPRYRRFLQSKDLSVKSEEDMACVLGRKRRRGEELQQPSMVSLNVCVVCLPFSMFI